MLVLAHRGYHAELPENTLVAFDAAVGLGVDGIETDVQVTRDGVPILFHDTEIQGRSVAGLTHVELCRLSQREVPTLVSALDAWPGIFWNLEIKMSRGPEQMWAILRESVWPVLREYREKRRLLVSSFWHSVAAQAGRELDLDCGLLVAHHPMSFTSLLVGLPDDLPTSRVSIVWEINGVGKTLIKAAREEGVKSYVYGPQGSSAHEWLATCDLAGIITDDPVLALNWLEALA